MQSRREVCSTYEGDKGHDYRRGACTVLQYTSQPPSKYSPHTDATWYSYENSSATAARYNSRKNNGNIRGNTSGGIHREHLVTKQDIHNVKNHYNITGVMRHSSDLTSVCAWVEEL